MQLALGLHEAKEAARAAQGAAVAHAHRVGEAEERIVVLEARVR